MILKEKGALALKEGKVDEEGSPKQCGLHRDVKVLGETGSAPVSKVNFFS